MAKICVYLHGQLLSELALMPGQEYFAGRASQSDIHLASERGISRQHVKIYEQDGAWHAHLLSKYGGMIFDGEPVEILELKGSTRFSIPPYDFVFEDETAQPAEHDEIVEATKPIHQETPEVVQDSAASASVVEPSLNLSPTPPEQVDEHTVLAKPAQLIPYLKIINNKLKTEEVLKLDGTSWQVGRNPDCEIVLNDSAISRRHLEISQKDGRYFVTDHGSSNGTHVNGLKIKPNEPEPLQSGDVLTIRHLEIVLELHNAAYEAKRESLPATFDTGNFDLEQIEPAADSAQPGVVVKMDSSWNAKLPLSANTRKRLIPVVIGVFVLIVVYALTRPQTPPNHLKGSADSASSGSPTLSSLTPEQKKQVVDFFNLAHNYYTERKYTLCLSQLERMTRLTPFYLNSKELQNLCQEGQQDEARALDREREEQEQQKTEGKVQDDVAKCRGLLNPSVTVSAMRSCLQRAIELDPSNSAVNDLMNQATLRQQQAQSAAARAESFRRRKQEGKNIFARAEADFQAGQTHRALKEFRAFMYGQYPGLNQQDDMASRRIASIQRTIQEKVAVNVNDCKNDISNDNLKAAIQACTIALNESPDNATAKDLKQRAYSRLSDEMRQIYEDSVLEENMGNIDSAKDKWMQIVHHSVPGEDYYKKAKQKLLDYGVVM